MAQNDLHALSVANDAHSGSKSGSSSAITLKLASISVARLKVVGSVRANQVIKAFQNVYELCAVWNLLLPGFSEPPPKDAAVHCVITPKERLALLLLACESRLVQIQSYSLKLGDKTFNLSLADIIYDSPKGLRDLRRRRQT